ncbi:MAG: DegT/DnrJ/EryC1/StrS family aminotransferase [Dehalococcoidaceae bacterium]|nr:DegT/DnrJ/EryC1/StrS family aminotransferase [Dehalococcoidaceae bacterium]
MLAVSKPKIYESTGNLLVEILFSGSLAQGRLVEQFEQAFAGYIGTDYAIAVSSGTAALHLSLLAHGIDEGDEVITTPFSFIASANAILYCRAKPVFCDINPVSFNLDPALIEARITPRTRAILGVHLYGQAFDVAPILDICKRHNLVLIEDACQAHGAEYKGAKAGSFGTGCFSFYPTKNMTTGEGGMIATNDEQIAQRCRMLRNHGQTERYYHTALGFNARMTEIAAAIGLGQLERLEDFNLSRLNNARVLSTGLDNIPGLIPPAILPDRKHVFHQYTIRVTAGYSLTRDQLAKHLETNGVGYGIHYPLPIHHQPLYRDLGYDDCLPRAETASGGVLSLPVHPSLTHEDLNTIIEVIRSA